MTPCTETQGEQIAGKPDPHLWSDLTHREQQVTALMVAGMTRKQMARAMGLSADTVRVHVLHAFRKANVHSAPQLIAKLYRLDPPKITALPYGEREEIPGGIPPANRLKSAAAPDTASARPQRATGVCPACRVRPKAQSGGYCRECHAAANRAYRKRNPLTPEQRYKDNARSYAGVYLRKGKIERRPCEACGAEKAEMHHEDYSKPLEVRWLCRPCHMAEHKGAAA